MTTRKATKRRFSEGGVTDEDLSAANASEDPIQTLNARKGWTDTGEGEAAPAVKKQSFKEAFAEARKGGGKTFEWNGKKFTTEMAGEKPAAKAPVKATAPDTGDETARLAARKPKATSSYETAADRYYRKVREDEAAEKSAKDSERAALRANIRSGTSGKVNPKTLLPMKKGGSVPSASRRGDGIAARGKTRGRMV